MRDRRLLLSLLVALSGVLMGCRPDAVRAVHETGSDGGATGDTLGNIDVSQEVIAPVLREVTLEEGRRRIVQELSVATEEGTQKKAELVPGYLYVNDGDNRPAIGGVERPHAPDEVWELPRFGTNGRWRGRFESAQAAVRLRQGGWPEVRW